jgi:hypothetical protein
LLKESNLSLIAEAVPATTRDVMMTMLVNLISTLILRFRSSRRQLHDGRKWVRTSNGPGKRMSQQWRVVVLMQLVVESSGQSPDIIFSFKNICDFEWRRIRQYDLRPTHDGVPTCKLRQPWRPESCVFLVNWNIYEMTDVPQWTLLHIVTLFRISAHDHSSKRFGNLNQIIPRRPRQLPRKLY